MLEWIRRKVMNMFQIKRMGMEKYNQAICPRIMAKLDVIKKDSKDSFAHFCGEYKFEVDYHDTTYTVDLKEKTCGCRQWNLTGIPCKHACAAIGLNKNKVEEYVHPCYSRDTYLGVYQHMIQSIPGKHDWVKSNNEEVLPPFMRRPSGRPKKARRKAAEEAEDVGVGLSRVGRGGQTGGAQRGGGRASALRGRQVGGAQRGGGRGGALRGGGRTGASRGGGRAGAARGGGRVGATRGGGRASATRGDGRASAPRGDT
ncbi:hypothetical protein RHMOL_Rhmol01G0159200 [Rhododendron molle]|uniref:Uncharacterized protein n=1 Tax=Rhododendron molle TaxID=49168 RepID=A0ACC0Q4Y4_RHOML|nr:hypothetical protein RHMOL_Rhmol01G0159200 [Rhododendron molle]